MTFDKWIATGKLLAGGELPQHVCDCDVQNAYVYDDGSYIEIDGGGDVVTRYRVLVGVSDSEFLNLIDARRALWSSHAQYNYE